MMNRTGAKMTFRIMGSPIATRLLLDVKIGGANISRRYETSLEFYLGAPSHVNDLHFEVVSPDPASDSEKREEIMLTWTTLGGVDIGTGLDLISFDTGTKATLSFMMTLSRHASIQDKTVKLLVTYTSDLEVALKEIIGSGPHRLPWHHYDEIT
jgi:hypothetical protein